MLLKESFYKRLDDYGHLNQIDLAKFIALFLMLLEHLYSYMFGIEDGLARLFGRLAAPIFFFLTGCARNHKIKPELYFWAIVLACQSLILKQGIVFNILVNFIIIKIFLANNANKLNSASFRWLIFIFCILLSPFYLVVEYGSFGVLFAVSALLRKHRDYWLWFIVISILYSYLQIIIFSWADNFCFSLTLLVMMLILGYWFFILNPTEKLWVIPDRVAFIIKICSRFSLTIYGVHLFLLRAIYG